MSISVLYNDYRSLVLQVIKQAGDTMTSTNIKRTALSLFAKHGYNGTSLSDIAKQVGMKKPSLYNHFSSKADLFLAVADEVFAAYVDYIEKALAQVRGTSVKMKLKQALLSTAQFLSSHDVGMMYMRMVMFPPAELCQDIRKRFESFEGKTDDMYMALFREGIQNNEIAPGDISVYVKSFYALLDGISTEMYMYSSEKMDAKIEASWTVFWQGICERN
ncbi:TetR/AcrR family transcriptional regulator [Alteribacillus persepolensis]|uniref:TetR/AcrR family transcriptional regulator n=1 Tax=Alteribacillus persepolensis TaxID=568899 RepID=UPI001C315606|nr:TetR/AcrR family transcriptional regulator [Alteribacillus persepolensis]